MSKLAIKMLSKIIIFDCINTNFIVTLKKLILFIKNYETFIRYRNR